MVSRFRWALISSSWTARSSGRVHFAACHSTVTQRVLNIMLTLLKVILKGLRVRTADSQTLTGVFAFSHVYFTLSHISLTFSFFVVLGRMMEPSLL
jgi:hypothetical protein